jgi:cellulose synthase/poly-beta-1,6-N-acetylglucosamine synthase-like glycosyltransferase
LIIELFEVAFILLTVLMISYLVRHYVFTLTVLRNAKKPAKANVDADGKFKPKVSIIIPARDEEKVIGRLLQRMTELTYPRHKLQVIVVDDASSDDTARIADEFSSRFPRFIKVLHRSRIEGGKGKATAMNFGFQHSTGEIVLSFDADYYPQKNIVETPKG